MQNWEYNYLVFKLENGMSIKDVIRLEALNKAGEEGWELVSVNPLGTSFLMYSFKRSLKAGASRPAARTSAAPKRQADKPARQGSLRDIQVDAQSQQQPQQLPQQGLNLQDILNSILGGDGKL